LERRAIREPGQPQTARRGNVKMCRTMSLEIPRRNTSTSQVGSSNASGTFMATSRFEPGVVVRGLLLRSHFGDVPGIVSLSGRMTRHSENALADTTLLDLCTDRPFDRRYYTDSATCLALGF